MSIKSKIFDVALHGFGPARTHEYLVIIPGAMNAALVVDSLTFPTITFGEVSLSYWGEEIKFQSTEIATGDWKIRIPESPVMFQKWEILKQMVRQKSFSKTRVDITVFPYTTMCPLQV